MQINLSGKLISKFWSFVNKTSDDNSCWLWTGCLVTGYGQIRLPRSNKKLYAHNLSFLLHSGEIPAGQDVCHSCNNKACVNPKHLYLASHMKNMADAVNAGLYPHKRSPELVAQIKDLAKSGMYHRQIAEATGVSPAHVSRVVNDKWSNRSQDSLINSQN